MTLVLNSRIWIMESNIRDDGTSDWWYSILPRRQDISIIVPFGQILSTDKRKDRKTKIFTWRRSIFFYTFLKESLLKRLFSGICYREGRGLLIFLGKNINFTSCRKRLKLNCKREINALFEIRSTDVIIFWPIKNFSLVGAPFPYSPL